MSTMERKDVSARRESLLGDEPGAFASARFVRITPTRPAGSSTWSAASPSTTR